MKTGGLGGLFFSIANARFVYRQLLASPRLASDGARRRAADRGQAALPHARADGRETAGARERRDSVGARARWARRRRSPSGAWEDDAGDRRWTRPTPAELRHDIDHFHLPPADDAAALARAGRSGTTSTCCRPTGSGGRSSRSSSAATCPIGRVGRAGAGDAARAGRRRSRRFTAVAPPGAVRFSTDATPTSRSATSTRPRAARRPLRGARPARDGGDARRRETVDVDLVVTPAPRAYFPGATLGERRLRLGLRRAGAARRRDGPHLRARPGAARCERYDGAQAYHDHNWGVWQRRDVGVGRRRAPARTRCSTAACSRPTRCAARAPLFLYVVDSLGFRALFRPREIRYEDGRAIARRTAARVRVPVARHDARRARRATRSASELEVEDATAHRHARAGCRSAARPACARALARPYFIQMKGRARISGRVGGVPLGGTGTGFFETYR